MTSQEKIDLIACTDPFKLVDEADRLRAEIDRLLAAIRRIDAINDNPYHFNSEINAECDKILRPELAK